MYAATGNRGLDRLAAIADFLCSPKNHRIGCRAGIADRLFAASADGRAVGKPGADALGTGRIDRRIGGRAAIDDLQAIEIDGGIARRTA